MDDELEHSPRSWLDDFTQRFSWCHPSKRASQFLNNYFLPGVLSFHELFALNFCMAHNDVKFFVSDQTLHSNALCGFHSLQTIGDVTDK